MRTIWKFPLRTRGWVTVDVGADARVVLAAIDPASGAPAVWIDHNPEDPPVPRMFALYATGQERGQEATHVGSMIDREFVWHIYERK